MLQGKLLAKEMSIINSRGKRYEKGHKIIVR